MFGLISFCACVWVSFSILFCSGGVEPGGLGVVRVLSSSWLEVLEHPVPPQTLPKMLLAVTVARDTRGLWSVFGSQVSMVSWGLLLGGGGLGEVE